LEGKWADYTSKIVLSKIVLALPPPYRVESQQFTLPKKVSHYGASEINKAENQQRG
jgi:hypothetical protein